MPKQEMIIVKAFVRVTAVQTEPLRVCRGVDLFASRGHRVLLFLVIIVGFGFSGRNVSDRFEQPSIIASPVKNAI
jgi:hypothetical protein